MSRGASGPWLPPGPWPLRRGFVAWRMLLAPLLAVVAVLVAFLGGGSAWRAAGAMVSEARIADRATGDVDATFEGRVDEHGWRGSGLFKKFRGNAVASANVDGRRLVAPVDFTLVVSSRHDMPALRVLYTDAPRAFTTTWHVDTRRERWLGFTIGLLVLAAAVAAPAWIAWGMWRRARSAAAIAWDGVEVLAHVDAEPARGWLARGRWSLFASWELDGSRHRLRIEQDPRHGGPLTVDTGALLLVSRASPGSALVVRQDLWPLRLPAHERAAILQRIAERNEQLLGDDGE